MLPDGDTAVLSGVVTEEWLAGNLISAEYTQRTCTHRDQARGLSSRRHRSERPHTSVLGTGPQS
jgi:hypothetical protein